MIIAVIIGFITGWLMSMPIGPVNAAVINRTLKNSSRHGIAVALGAALMDMIYCGGAAQINQFLVESPIINLVFLTVGCLALFYMGIKQLRGIRAEAIPKVEKPDLEVQEEQDARAASAMKRIHFKKRELLGPFIVGVLLYATNVAAVAEWIIVAGIWRSWHVLGIGFDINAAFALGAGFGTFGWYIVLIKWIAKRRQGFAPSTLRKINIGTGVAMLLFGGYFVFQIAFRTNWDVVRTKAVTNTQSIIDSVAK